jgi:hypothetical protein
VVVVACQPRFRQGKRMSVAYVRSAIDVPVAVMAVSGCAVARLSALFVTRYTQGAVRDPHEFHPLGRIFQPCSSIATWRKKFPHSVELTDLTARPILRRSPGIGRSAVLRNNALDLLNAISVGVGRMGRQVKDLRTYHFNRLLDAGNLRWQIIHDDDIAALERWSKGLLDIGKKHRPVRCAIKHEGRNCGYRKPTLLPDQNILLNLL